MRSFHAQMIYKSIDAKHALTEELLFVYED